MVSCDFQIETRVMSQDWCQVASLFISPYSDAKDGPQRDQWAVHGKLALQHQAQAMIGRGGWWIEENSMTKYKVIRGASCGDLMKGRGCIGRSIFKSIGLSPTFALFQGWGFPLLPFVAETAEEVDQGRSDHPQGGHHAFALARS